MDTQKLREQILELSKQYFISMIAEQNERNYVPVSGKVLGIDELLNMQEASLDMWLTSGRFNAEFESEFAKYLNAKHALSVNSGSSANLLAISALMSHKLKDRAIKKCDEVITVATCFPTTVAAIVNNGLIPVFVDCEINTCNIDVTKIEQAISKRTKAIFIAHTLGNPFEIDKVVEICKKYKLWLIEDACDALGSKFDNKYVGTFGDISTFSFYPAHHITMGEGGAVVTNNTELYKILLSFRDWGRQCCCKLGVDNTCNNRFNLKRGNLPHGYDHKYVYSHLGYNFKITDWQAAIGVAQLKKINDFVVARKENVKFLLDQLSDLKKFFILPNQNNRADSAWFGFLISIRPEIGFSMHELVLFLEQHKICTRSVFAGNILRQPAFVESDINIKIGNISINSRHLNDALYNLLPNTDFIMNNSFWVGCFHGLLKEDLKKISDVIHEFIVKQEGG